jgi:hypothetical protein
MIRAADRARSLSAGGMFAFSDFPIAAFLPWFPLAERRSGNMCRNIFAGFGFHPTTVFLWSLGWLLFRLAAA